MTSGLDQGLIPVKEQDSKKKMGKGRTWNYDATLRMPQGSQLRLAPEKSHVGLKCLGSSITAVHVFSHWLGAVQEECGPGLNSPVAPIATPYNQCRFFPWGKNDHPCCYMAWYTKQNKNLVTWCFQGRHMTT